MTVMGREADRLLKPETGLSASGPSADRQLLSPKVGKADTQLCVVRPPSIAAGIGTAVVGGAEMRPAAVLRTRVTEFGRGLGDFRHNAGADNWATIASLNETCKLNTVDPLAYLTATLIARS